MGKFISFLLGLIPNIFKAIQDRKRINEVDKIDKAVSSGDDKSVNTVLRGIKDKEDKRTKANS